MPKTIDRDEVRKLLDHGTQLVEVLPVDEYEEDHLPDAISLPLRRIDREAATILDLSRPVIVYCWDVS
jgi:phage shock protein E